MPSNTCLTSRVSTTIDTLWLQVWDPVVVWISCEFVVIVPVCQQHGDSQHYPYYLICCAAPLSGCDAMMQFIFTSLYQDTIGYSHFRSTWCYIEIVIRHHHNGIPIRIWCAHKCRSQFPDKFSIWMGWWMDWHRDRILISRAGECQRFALAIKFAQRYALWSNKPE